MPTYVDTMDLHMFRDSAEVALIDLILSQALHRTNSAIHSCEIHLFSLVKPVLQTLIMLSWYVAKRFPAIASTRGFAAVSSEACSLVTIR